MSASKNKLQSNQTMSDIAPKKEMNGISNNNVDMHESLRFFQQSQLLKTPKFYTEQLISFDVDPSKKLEKELESINEDLFTLKEDNFWQKNEFKNLVFNKKVSNEAFYHHLLETYKGLAHIKAFAKPPSKALLEKKQIDMKKSSKLIMLLINFANFFRGKKWQISVFRA